MVDGCRRLLYLVIKYEAMIFVGLALAQQDAPYTRLLA